ncbi:MAG: hypothetical protein K2Q11_10340 [Burkholderiaceae bacterium]|nr:hypothetical protein [Burkholderiaceae bacterium]
MLAGSLEIELMANIARLQADMNQAVQSVQSSGQKISAEMGRIGNSIEAMMNPIKAINAAFGPLLAAIGGLAITDKIRGVITGMAELDAMAKKTGASVEALSALKGITKGVGGSLEEVGNGLAKLSSKLVDAQNGSKSAQASFDSLGLDPTKFKSSEDAMLGISKKIAGLSSGYEQVSAAQDFFGKGGAALLPTLLNLAKTGELNGKVTAEQAAQAVKFEQAMAKLGGRFSSIYTDIASALLPTLVKVTDGFGTFAKIGVAYILAFTVAPAVFGASTAALGSLQMMVALAKLEMAQGATFATLFSGAIGSIQLPAEASAGALGLLKIAAGVLFAAFAGWEIGKWLRDNFLEAQLAGIAFVEGTLVAWEAIKYGAGLAWAAISSLWSAEFEIMGSVLSGFLQKVAGGLDSLGLSSAAASVMQWAGTVEKSTASTTTLATKTKELGAEYDAATAAIRANTGDMAQYAIASFGATQATEKQGNALKKTATDAKEVIDPQIKAYADLVAAIQEKIAVNNQEAALGRVLNEAEKQVLDIQKQVAKGTISAADASSERTQKLLDEQKASQRAKDNAIALAAAYAELYKQNQDRISAYEKTVAGMEDETKKMRDEIALIGLTAQQQEAVLRGRRELTIATKEATLAEMERKSAITGTHTREELALATEIGQLKERNALAGIKFDRSAVVEGSKAWGDMWASVDQTAHDVFTNVQGDGQNAFERIGKTLKAAILDMLYQMSIKQWIIKVQGQLTGVGPTGAASTQNGLNTQMGAAMQAVFGNTAGASMASLGYANAVGAGGGDALGALIAANGQWAGVTTSATAAAQAAVAANTALEAGTAVALESGTMAAAAGTASAAAGGGIMSTLAAIPGWGWAAAGLGLLLSSGIGKTPGEQHSGAYYSSSGKEANLTNAMAVTRGGGWDDGAWARDLINRTNPEVRTLVGSTVDSIINSTTAKAKAMGMTIALGIDAGLASNPNGVDKTTYGYFQIYKDGQASGDNYANRALGTDPTAATGQWAKDMADAAAEAVLAGTGFKRVGETASAALDRLAASLQGANAVFAATGSKVLEVSVASADAASQLVDKFGGMDKFSASATAYYDIVTTQQEKTTATFKKSADAIDAVGIAVPMTTAELKAMVQGLDVTTEAGRTAYASLVQLAPAVAKIKSASLAALGVGADTLTGIVQGFLQGKTTAADAGVQFGDAVSTGLRNAISAAGAAAIVDIFVGQIITTIVQSVMAGSTLQDALSSGDISGALAQAKTTAAVYAAVLNDPAIKSIGTMMSQAFGLAASGATDAADTIKDAGVVIRGGADEATNPVNTLAASTAALGDAARGAQSAADAAAASLNAIPKDIQINVAVNAGANAQGSFAVGSPYIPKDMLAQIHQGEMVIDSQSAGVLRKYGINASASINSKSVGDTVANSLLGSIDKGIGEIAPKIMQLTTSPRI